jgi:hypothetical protein
MSDSTGVDSSTPSAGAATEAEVRGRRLQPPLLDRNPRLALVVFVGLLVVAAGLYFWLGRGQWFYLDEWDFLADRQLTRVDDLLRPHNEHWSTMSIVLYRILWRVVGLHAYWPYQLFSIANHLAIAALLRVVMRRAGVGPWIATGAAGAFVLFGSGDQDILWAFQVQFAGALTFGLIQLLLAGHDGPLDRRDWLGLLAGLAAIMSSGLGVAMVGVVGIATLLRRGWRIATFQTVPLALIYSWWYVAYGREALPSDSSGLDLTRRFVFEAYNKTFGALGMVPGVGLLLAVVLIVGLGLAWHRIDRPDVRRLAAAPLAMMLGSLAFLAITGWGRAWVFGVEFASRSRYLHVAAALLLPALAVAINALYSRWRAVGIGACVLLLIGIPGNIRQTVNYEERNPFALGQPDLFLATANSPLLREVPRDLRPFPESGLGITAGWLEDGVDDGKIPRTDGPADALSSAVVGFRLGLRQVDGPGDPVECRPLTEPVNREMNTGDVIDFSDGQLQVFSNDPEVPRSYFVPFSPEAGDRLVAVLGPLSLRIASRNPFLPASLCS